MKRTLHLFLAVIIIFTSLFAFPISIHADNAFLVTQTTVRPGEDITVSVPTGVGTSNAWVGFYKAEDPDTSYISWAYLNKLSNSTYSVKAPKTLGNYNFRIFNDSGYTKLLTSNSVQVIQYTPSFSLSSTSVNPGKKISVSFSGGPIFTDGWIGFYKKNSSNEQYISWQYTKGNNSGVYEVVVPKDPGTYNFRMFLDYGYTLIGTSQDFYVEQYKPTLTVQTQKVNKGAKVAVVFSGAPVFADAWVGMFNETANDNQYLTFTYTEGKETGTLEFTAPNTTGRYNFRIFLDNGYTKLATSSTFEVTEGDISPTSTPTSTPIPTTILNPTGSPNLPYGWTKVESSSGKVSLAWHPYSNTNDIIGYNLYRRTATGNSQYTIVTDFPLTNNSHEDVNVENGVMYYYICKALLKNHTEVTLTDEASVTVTYFKKNQIVLQINNPIMYVNGKAKEIDPGRGTKPVLVNSRTLLPIRALIEELGGSVGWEDSTRRVTLTLGSKIIVLTIDSKNTLVNGVPETIDVAPALINSRTMLPLRFIIEKLGYNVTWEPIEQKIFIEY